jgi:hypothetical protein
MSFFVPTLASGAMAVSPRSICSLAFSATASSSCVGITAALITPANGARYGIHELTYYRFVFIFMTASSVAVPKPIRDKKPGLADHPEVASWAVADAGLLWNDQEGRPLPSHDHMKAKPMTDDLTTPPEELSAASKLVDSIKVAGSTVGDAIETGLEPGMPLDIIVKAVRQSPLAALGIAFLLGVVYARPRR